MNVHLRSSLYFPLPSLGVLNEKEMEKVARAFSPDKGEAALLEDVKVIMDKLNTKQTGAIDEEEWVSFLLTMFQFMNAAAFERHCNELLAVVDGIEKASQASGKR